MKNKTIRFFTLILTIVLITNFYNNSNLYANEKEQKKPELNVVDGKDADIKDYPWQVALFSLDEKGDLGYQMCGGSIIDPFWILTAAHCVDTKAWKIQKIVAAITRNDYPEIGQVIEISDCIVHPLYNDSLLQNDLALLRLAMPVDTSKLGTSVIRMLTAAEELGGAIDPGTMATITGWGNIEYRAYLTSEVLQVGEVPIISISTANNWYSQTHPDAIRIIESMLPVGHEQGGTDACHGDSGGPLAVKDSTGNWALAGVTSWGYYCGAPKRPGVFTRVPYYYDWIMENTGIGIDNPSELNKIDIISTDFNNRVSKCGNNFDFGDVLIRNYGTNNINNFQIKVKAGYSPDNLNISDSITVNLSQPLLPKGSKRVALPSVSLTEFGNYFYEITLSKPNGNDVALTNSISSGTFQYTTPGTAKIHLELGSIDNVEWSLTNYKTNTIMALGSYGSSNSNKTFDNEVCLPDGSYQFFIQGEGNFDFQININYNGEDYMIGDGQNSYYEYVNFEIPFIPKNDLTIFLSYPIGADSMFICEGESFNEHPGIYIYNVGTLKADSVKLRINSNGTISDLTIDEAVSPRSYFPVDFEFNNLIMGKNTISVEILSYVNSEFDDTPEDNKAELEFYILEQPEFATLQIYPNEDSFRFSYDIVNWKDDRIVTGSVSSEEYFLDLCLPEGCYTFFPYDWEGTGMDTDTAVVLRKYDGEILFAIKGVDFVPSKPVIFCNGVVDVEEYYSFNFHIYPNPASDKLFINTNTVFNKESEILIYDLIGNVFYHENDNINFGKNRIIDISNFASGMYYIRISSGKDVVVKQFFVVK
ncbi:MAG: trypsin-like serine protease [bacterium]